MNDSAPTVLSTGLLGLIGRSVVRKPCIYAGCGTMKINEKYLALRSVTLHIERMKNNIQNAIRFILRNRHQENIAGIKGAKFALWKYRGHWHFGLTNGANVAMGVCTRSLFFAHIDLYERD